MSHLKNHLLVMLLISFILLLSCDNKKAAPKPKIKSKVTTAKPDTHKADSITTAKKVIEVKKQATKKAVYKKPYHLIIGSYTSDALAKIAYNKAKEMGFKPYYVSRFNGKYTAVSIASFADIHQAYNNMYNIQDEYGLEDVWVLFQEKK
jgi:SPOR domain